MSGWYEFVTVKCPECGAVDRTQQKVTSECPESHLGVQKLVCWECGHMWDVDFHTGVSINDFMNEMLAADEYREIYKGKI